MTESSSDSPNDPLLRQWQRTTDRWARLPDWAVRIAYTLAQPVMHPRVGGTCRMPGLCEAHSWVLVDRRNRRQSWA